MIKCDECKRGPYNDSSGCRHCRSNSYFRFVATGFEPSTMDELIEMYIDESIDTYTVIDTAKRSGINIDELHIEVIRKQYKEAQDERHN